eukprot:3206551-Rhodomonas_salina.1
MHTPCTPCTYATHTLHTLHTAHCTLLTLHTAHTSHSGTAAVCRCVHTRAWVEAVCTEACTRAGAAGEGVPAVPAPCRTLALDPQLHLR